MHESIISREELHPCPRNNKETTRCPQSLMRSDHARSNQKSPHVSHSQDIKRSATPVRDSGMRPSRTGNNHRPRKDEEATCAAFSEFGSYLETEDAYIENATHKIKQGSNYTSTTIPAMWKPHAGPGVWDSMPTRRCNGRGHPEVVCLAPAIPPPVIRRMSAATADSFPAVATYGMSRTNRFLSRMSLLVPSAKQPGYV